METKVVDSEDLFAESNGIQENRKLQDKGIARPILPRTSRIMSYLVVPKLMPRHPQS